MPTLQQPIAHKATPLTQGHTPLLQKQVPRRKCDLALASARRWGEREEKKGREGEGGRGRGKEEGRRKGGRKEEGERD